MSAGDSFWFGLFSAGAPMTLLLISLLNNRNGWREAARMGVKTVLKLEAELAELRAECGRCRDCGTKDVPRLFFTPNGAGTKCECGNVTNLD
jgi:hypothetical protein